MGDVREQRLQSINAPPDLNTIRNVCQLFYRSLPGKRTSTEVTNNKIGSTTVRSHRVERADNPRTNPRTAGASPPICLTGPTAEEVRETPQAGLDAGHEMRTQVASTTTTARDKPGAASRPHQGRTTKGTGGLHIRLCIHFGILTRNQVRRAK